MSPLRVQLARRSDDGALLRIRARRAELLARWRELPAGETLDLTFNRNGTRP